MISYSDIIGRHKLLSKTIQELEQALLEIRGLNNWEIGIEKDERASVKLLWASLQDNRHQLAVFLKTKIQDDEE